MQENFKICIFMQVHILAVPNDDDGHSLEQATDDNHYGYYDEHRSLPDSLSQ